MPDHPGSPLSLPKEGRRARRPTIHHRAHGLRAILRPAPGEDDEPSFGAILWSHPLGCHRPRIPERVVFEKLVQVLLCGCAYERIADGSSCSASTLSGIIATSGSGWGIERLREMALEAYDRAIGLQSSRSWRWVALQPGRPAGATGRVRTP